MNYYETGARMSNSALDVRLAVALALPATYSYAVDHLEADLIVRSSRLQERQKKQNY